MARSGNWLIQWAGTALLGWAPGEGTADGITVTAHEPHDDPVVEQLRQIVDAQYAWTTAVFGG